MPFLGLNKWSNNWFYGKQNSWIYDPRDKTTKVLFKMSTQIELITTVHLILFNAFTFIFCHCAINTFYHYYFKHEKKLKYVF